MVKLKIIVLLSIYLFFFSLDSVNADVTVYDDVFFHCDKNETYNVTNNLSFSKINVKDDTLTFNMNEFFITHDNRTNITLNFLLRNFMIFYNTTLLDFDMNCTGNRTINISGFYNDYTYDLIKNGTYVNTLNVMNSNISFNESIGNIVIDGPTNWMNFIQSISSTISGQTKSYISLIIGFCLCFGNLFYMMCVRKNSKCSLCNILMRRKNNVK